MVSHMETTIDIADDLYEELRRTAHENDTTMREIIEQGVRRALAERKKKPAFKLRDASVKGNGFQPEFQGASWEKIRDAIYEGHGA